MKLFKWLKGKKKSNESEMKVVTDSIVTMLTIQTTIAGDKTPDTTKPNGVKGLGYIYGVVDAALHSAGQNMSDISIGVPVLYQVLRTLFPDSEDHYLDFITSSLNDNSDMMTGIMKGGQQYVDWLNGKLSFPSGLARYLVESEVD